MSQNNSNDKKAAMMPYIEASNAWLNRKHQ